MANTFNHNDKVVITDGGSVGIGTTSPGQKLDVVGASSADTYGRFLGGAGGTKGGIIIGNNDSGKNYGSLYFDNSNNNVYLYQQYNTGSLILGTNTTERFRITSNGNVGIGTTSPTQKLDVSGNAQVQGILYVTKSGENSRFNSADANGAYVSFRNNGTAKGYIGSGYHLWTSPNNIADNFGIRAENQLDFGIGASVKMTLSSSGNVGIGTTSPGAKFHLQGSNLMATFRNSSTGANQYTQLEFIAGSRSAYIWLGNQNSTSWAGDGGLNIYTTTGNMDFWTAASQRMRITSAGNVGIGTTSPSTRLEVVSSQTNSSIRTGGLEMQSYAVNNGWYAENLYFDGGAWRLRSAGYATQIYMGAGSINFVRFATGNAGDAVAPYSTMYLTPTGNVGIGTTSPSTYLHIYGTGIRSSVRIGGATTTAGQGRIFIEYNQDNSYIDAYSNGAYNDLSIQAKNLLLNTFSGGNVGIGTTSPGARLEVQGNGSSVDILRVRYNASYYTDYSSNNLNFTGTNQAYQIKNNGSAVITINASSNVGIGTTSPNQKLHVDGTVLINSGAGASTFNDLNIGGVNGWSNGEAHRINFVYGDGGSIFQTIESYYGGSGTGRMRFRNFFTSGASSDILMTIHSNGNVGIGTDSPTAKLQVQNGNIGLYSDSYGNTGMIRLFGTDNSEKLQVGSLSSNGFLFSPDGIGLSIYTGGSENVRITSGGNVGIGTTGPSYKLEVSGTSYFSGLAHFGQTATSGSAFRWGAYGTAVSSDTMLCMNQLWNGSGWSIISSSLGTTFINLGSAVAAPDISFGTGGANTSATTKVIIKNNGNVGIGTTSPAYKLDVSGGAIAIRGNAAGNSLRFDDSAGTSRNAFYVDTSNYLNIGNANYAGVKFVQTASAPNTGAFDGQSVQQAVGTTDEGVVLAAPDAWLAVRVGTTDYAIPMYSVG